ncbi:MAG: hypothetical protein E4H14_01975 [Candidatus Thorarchaeota archaeon]|nr:MAG: hypothetical protein E4H14_01975 [Candidatus Thorarchaeota archaeon]
MKVMSWNDRFALINHYQPTDAVICKAFNVEPDELATARQLLAAGSFGVNSQLDVKKYDDIFAVPAGNTVPVSTAPAKVATPATKPTGKKGGATVHVKPESATKKAKLPQKRGRKGDKISRALQAVTSTPVAVDSFIKQYGVSLAVLRQSKRFLEKMDNNVAKKIGKINVRQDKNSKQLMIWREEA